MNQSTSTNYLPFLILSVLLLAGGVSCQIGLRARDARLLERERKILRDAFRESNGAETKIYGRTVKLVIAFGEQYAIDEEGRVYTLDELLDAQQKLPTPY